MSRAFDSVVIIGAGRSGTKILRDSLSALPGAGTWPCDEINYIWRHGNALNPDDELRPDQATPRVRRFIRRRFSRLADRLKLDLVVEKTCANSLRVGFVASVLPEARFVFLVRDGRDVVASAIQRWQAPLDIPYLLRKARFVPLSDLPYYGIRYAWNRLRRLTSRERSLAFWGPRFKGMDTSRRTESLPVVCARQWRRCVERAEEDLSSLPEERVYRLHYEDLVRRPGPVLAELARFLGGDATPDGIDRVAAGIRPGRVGAWREALDNETRKELRPILDEPLTRLGYELD